MTEALYLRGLDGRGSIGKRCSELARHVLAWGGRGRDRGFILAEGIRKRTIRVLKLKRP
jgi:hypothetical protein